MLSQRNEYNPSNLSSFYAQDKIPSVLITNSNVIPFKVVIWCSF